MMTFKSCGCLSCKRARNLKAAQKAARRKARKAQKAARRKE